MKHRSLKLVSFLTIWLGVILAAAATTTFAGVLFRDMSKPAAYQYTATAQFMLPTGSALNDFVTFTGSATSTVYITSLEKQCVVGSSPTNWTNVMVRRTSETGGTFTAWPAAPNDKNAPSAGATFGDYHVALTTGNSGGSVFLQRYVDRIPVNSSGTFFDILRDTWGQGYAMTTHIGQLMLPGAWSSNQTPTVRRPGSPLVLRGTSDILALTTSFAPPNGIKCNFNVTWYEKPNTIP